MCLCSDFNVSVVVNFYLMYFFVFLLFLGMVMYANDYEVEKRRKIKIN